MWLWGLLLGGVAGSAANAVIDRVPRGESWVRGRSKCDKCGHLLSGKDLVPIASWVVLGGKCRYCGSPIPRRNLVIEAFLGICFALIFNFQFSIFNQFTIFNLLIFTAMLWVTTVIAVMDWETRLVSEAMVGLWGILVILWQVAPLLSKFSIFNSQFTINFQLPISQFSNNILGLVVGLGLIGGIWAASRGRAMGFGDVEIAAVMGWWLGWPNIAVALWVGFVSGAVVGVIKLIKRLSNLKSEIAFGPFLIAGAWMAYFWGDKIWAWIFP